MDVIFPQKRRTILYSIPVRSLEFGQLLYAIGSDSNSATPFIKPFIAALFHLLAGEDITVPAYQNCVALKSGLTVSTSTLFLLFPNSILRYEKEKNQLAADAPAIEPGAATEKHKLFSIPQIELDANKAVVRNPGY